MIANPNTPGLFKIVKIYHSPARFYRMVKSKRKLYYNYTRTLKKITQRYNNPAVLINLYSIIMKKTNIGTLHGTPQAQPESIKQE